jgi:hypothetical protein
MDIDRNEVIASHPIKLVRDILKGINENASFYWIAEQVGLSELGPKPDRVAKARVRNRTHPNSIDPELRKRTQALIDAMIGRGWLEVMPEREHGRFSPYYQSTMAGNRLATMRWLKRIPRARAEQTVAELSERAKEINTNPELITFVERIYAFGSYITDAADLGDIDVIAVYSRRPVDGDTNENWVKES